MESDRARKMLLDDGKDDEKYVTKWSKLIFSHIFRNFRKLEHGLGSASNSTL